LVLQWIPHSVLDQTFQLLEAIIRLALPPIFSIDVCEVLYLGEDDEGFANPPSQAGRDERSNRQYLWIPPSLVVNGICSAMLDRFTVHSQSYRSARHALVQLLNTSLIYLPAKDDGMADWGIAELLGVRCHYFEPLVKFCFEAIGFHPVVRCDALSDADAPRVVAVPWNEAQFAGGFNESVKLHVLSEKHVIGIRAPAISRDEALEERLVLLFECCQHLSG
jgi:hypothetical protein